MYSFWIHVLPVPTPIHTSISTPISISLECDSIELLYANRWGCKCHSSQYVGIVFHEEMKTVPFFILLPYFYRDISLRMDTASRFGLLLYSDFIKINLKISSPSENPKAEVFHCSVLIRSIFNMEIYEAVYVEKIFCQLKLQRYNGKVQFIDRQVSHFQFLLR